MKAAPSSSSSPVPLLLLVVASLLPFCAHCRLFSPSVQFLRSAPQMCPIDDGNLVDVKLFIAGEQECFRLCERTPGCSFFRYFDAEDLSKPSQCFLFRSCGRSVEAASADCVLNEENTIEVKPFVKSEGDCKSLCQQERKCGYFKYIPRSAESAVVSRRRGGGALRRNDKDASEALAGINSLIAGRLQQSPTTAAPKDEFCYTLRSCSKRMVDNVQCTLGRNNFLDVEYFVPSLESCQLKCQETPDCRYYWWYPIKDSEHPQFCYLYRQCAAQDSEPEVAFVLGGRHPGHYFMTKREHSDLIMRSEVCMVTHRPSKNVSLARAGAVSEYVGGVVLFCGGKDGVSGLHDDCLRYDPGADEWAGHSRMSRARYESASAAAGQTLFVMGGVDESSVEFIDASRKGAKWQSGPSLPAVTARACAAAVDGDTVILSGGHGNGTAAGSVRSARMLSASKGKWIELAEMNHARRDHACVFVEFETTSGVLVTGGLGEDDAVLDSAEFYDLGTRKWTLTSSLKQGRTEHSMSVIYGIPTVIGGLREGVFLSSLEQFDKSSSSWNVPLQRDWRVINHALNAPRYEMAVASIPISKVTVLAAKRKIGDLVDDDA